MNAKAKDIMRRKVVTVESWLTLQELAKVFQDRCISGAPVVDGSGLVLGVVSQTDLVRTRRDNGSAVPLFHAEADQAARSIGMHLEELDGIRVEQIMTPGAIAFDESTPVSTLAKAMLERHIHRVLITRRDRLCGIVSTMDILKAVTRAPRARARRR